MDLAWAILKVYLVSAFISGCVIALYIIWLFRREERKPQSET